MEALGFMIDLLQFGMLIDLPDRLLLAPFVCYNLKLQIDPLLTHVP